MLSWSPQPSDVVAVLAILAAMGFAWLWWRAETRGGRRSRSRQIRARRGEASAEAMLESAGFAVLERQVEAQWAMEVDEDTVMVRSRADLLVEARRVPGIRHGRRFVAEVKTGTRAPDPTFPATRRQLLEYRIAFDVDGVLLVDMETRRIRRVRFGQVRPG